MNIGKRLETIGRHIPQGCVLADIGTDHAYLPVWLLQQQKIQAAIAGDIAEGPCQAARNTVAMHGLREKVKVRCGNGLKVLNENEADCIAIAGMGGSTMIEILAADIQLAQKAKVLVLQPMAGAPALRRWLCANGWYIDAEDLAEEGGHLYEIIVAVRGKAPAYTDVEYEVGPCLLRSGHILLPKQLQKLCSGYKKMLVSMEKSTRASQSDKFKQLSSLLRQLEDLNNECKCS